MKKGEEMIHKDFVDGRQTVKALRDSDYSLKV